jgi:hypothetical protein
VTRLGAGRQRNRALISAESKVFSVSESPDELRGLPSLLLRRHGRSFSGIRRPKRDDHMTPLNAEVQNECS